MLYELYESDRRRKKEIEKHSDLDCVILGQRINRKGNLVVGSVEEKYMLIVLIT